LIVLDASSLIELLLSTPKGKSVAARISAPEESLHVPQLADIEVTHVLRRLARERDIDAGVAELAISDLRSLDLERHAHEPYLGRVWALRDGLSAYDAIYVSLAEVLEATLLTCDARMARARGLACRIELIAR